MQHLVRLSLRHFTALIAPELPHHSPRRSAGILPARSVVHFVLQVQVADPALENMSDVGKRVQSDFDQRSDRFPSLRPPETRWLLSTTELLRRGFA